MQKITLVQPQSFEPHNHWYPKALNAQIHPLIQYFMNMSLDRIVTRYSYLNPGVDESELRKLLQYKSQHMQWAGTDLMHTTTASGRKRIVVIETNSCPSGQKSFPLLDVTKEYGQYETLIRQSFLPLWKKARVKSGVTAVFYDKNEMENSGYAATIADVIKENVYLVNYETQDLDSIVKIDTENKNTIYLKIGNDWKPVRAIFRYVTQKPWNRLPITSRTVIFNPILACIAGGRNKLLAAKAYDFLNADLKGTNLQVVVPQTIWDVNKNELPLYLERLNFKGVIKIPYSNAGQGVFIITSKAELKEFMSHEYPYDQFIVQQLIGHPEWSSQLHKDVLYQVGTIPNKKSNSYVFDLRMIVHSTSEGIRPLAMYSRKTGLPLRSEITSESRNDMLLTNLSIKKENGWDTDVSRLLLMDGRDFNRLGIGLDELIEGYVQSVLAFVAIDSFAGRLVSKKKTFKRRLFSSLNDDEKLLEEIFG